MVEFSRATWHSKCSPGARQDWGEYSSESGSIREAHLRDLKTQFVSALLFVLTVAAVCCATINFRQQSLYRLADDGVIWVDRTDSAGRNTVFALHVLEHVPDPAATLAQLQAVLEAARLGLIEL